MTANLPISLLPSIPASPGLNGSAKPTVLRDARPSQPTPDAGSDTRVGTQATTFSGGGDQDALDQAFIDWQPEVVVVGE